MGKLIIKIVREWIKMNHEKLSRRLEHVSLHIPKDSILGDIGSDHAYLPCYAIQQQLCKKAIAGEVVEGPYQSARKHVSETGLEAEIDVRKGDGLNVLEIDEATAITIAGMGGILIASILDRGKDKLRKVERLILQPNIGSQHVRVWLMENGWELIDEEILEEDGKIYEVLIAEQGDALKPYSKNRELEIQFGPILMKQHHPVFTKKWMQEKKHLEKIIEQLDMSGKRGLEAKRKELLEKIATIGKVLGQ